MRHIGELVSNQSDIAPAETSNPASLWQRIKGPLITLVALVVVFGWLLPQIIDYGAVVDALRSLTWANLALLTALTALRVVTEALVYRAMLPGLRIWPGSEAYLSSNVAANFLPPPAPSVIQFAYFRSEGFDAGSSMTGAVGSFVFPQAGRIVLPIVAFVGLLATGQADGTALVITLVALAITIVLAVVIRMIGRSETSARWVGRQLARVVSWVLVKFKRDPIDDLGPQVVDFRDNAYSIVRERWLFGSMSVAANLFLSYLILLAALRFLDVPSNDLSNVVIFACFAAAFFAGTVIPITGSGLGIVDAALIGSLGAAASTTDNSVIVAAVVIWRIFYSLVTLPFGALTMTVFTRRHPGLISGAKTAFTDEGAEG
jgi:uncharacterized membrane protein YbhN (UPF0104 family)